MTALNRLTRTRRGFTLIELLVAVGILLVIATLGAYFLPRMQANARVSSAADKIQGMLVIGKQRAKRDQLRTGVRILFNNGVATQLVYIQQPEDLAIGRYVGSADPSWDAITPPFDVGPIDFMRL